MKLRREPAERGPATTYESLTFALTDAVWSIGVRYAGVPNVVERAASTAAVPVPIGQASLRIV